MDKIRKRVPGMQEMIDNSDLRDSTKARQKTAASLVQLAAFTTLVRYQEYFNTGKVMSARESQELVRLTKWWSEFGAKRQTALLTMAEHLSEGVEEISRLIL